MKNKIKNILQNIGFSVFIATTVFVFFAFTEDTSADLSCSGVTNICNISCSQSWSESDTDYSLIWNAWRGSKFSFDDDASHAYGYSRTGPSDSYSGSEHAQDGQYRGFVCQCGQAGGCAQTYYPPAFEFFSVARGQLGGRDSVNGSLNVLQKRDTDMNAYGGEVAFGVSVISCAAGERTVFDPSGRCVDVTGSISASVTSGTTPLSPVISVVSNGVTTSGDGVKVTKDGVDWRSSNSTSGSWTDSNLAARAAPYRYCVLVRDGYGSWWNVNQCVNVQVNTVSAGTPVIGASWGENNSSSLNKTVSPGASSLKFPYTIRNIGTSGSTFYSRLCGVFVANGKINIGLIDDGCPPSGTPVTAP